MLVFWVLTSSTYALDLNLTQYGDNYSYTPEYSTQKSNYTFFTYSAGKDLSTTATPTEKPGYFNTLWHKFYWYKNKWDGYSFTVYWFAYKTDWEWITLYQAKYRGNEQYYNTLSLPSRVGYLYTSSAGVKNLFKEIFVNDNQFILYAPETNYCVSFVGDVKLENMMIVSNPWKDEQNLWIIQCQKMKAYSLTVDKNQAWEIWKGNWVNKSFLKSLNFEKSYTITTGGTYLFPEWMRQIDQRRWFVYTEDIELQSMDWWGGTTNNPNGNQWGNSDGSYKERLAEYNQCASYRQNVKTYTLYDRECYRWLLDDPADNRDFDIRLAPWKAIVDWNWEGELDIKTKDPICLKFKSRKPVYMAKYKDKRDEFIKDSQEYWLNPSQTINVAEKCGTRPFPIKQAEEKSWLWLIAEKASNLIDGFKEKRKNEKDRMGQNWSDWKRFFNWTYEYYEWGKVGTWPLWIIKEMRKEAWLSWELWWFLWVLDDLANNFKKWQDFYPKFNVCSKKPISKERDYILIIPFMLIIFYLLKIMR